MKTFYNKKARDLAYRHLNQFINFNTRVRSFLRVYECESKTSDLPPLVFRFYTHTHCVGQYGEWFFDSYGELVKFYLTKRNHTFGTFGDVLLEVGLGKPSVFSPVALAYFDVR